ncbi:MAG: hypothetical protein WCK18_19555 [Prolixibacteraceae bacterium]
MKTLATLFLVLGSLSVLVFSSCAKKEQKNVVTNNGKVLVENGRGKMDSIRFNCTGCAEKIKDSTLFNAVIKTLTSDAKNSLKYPLSFVPTSLTINIFDRDSVFYFDYNKKIDSLKLVFSKYNYIAKNAYGTEIEGSCDLSLHLKGNSIVNIDGEIRLEKLKFNEKVINRNLYLYSKSDDASVEIIPVTNKYLILNSSSKCVDKGSALTISFVNGEELEITSWNDFNCEGNSYFKPFNAKQVAILKKEKIKNICFSAKEVVCYRVPKNKSDYFIQLMNLYKL